MKEPREVIIDGVRYIPARDAYPDIREQVCRGLAALFWGELGANWKAKFDRHLDGTRVVITDEVRGYESCPTTHEVVDDLMNRLAKGNGCQG